MTSSSLHLHHAVSHPPPPRCPPLPSKPHPQQPTRLWSKPHASNWKHQFPPPPPSTAVESNCQSGWGSSCFGVAGWRGNPIDLRSLPITKHVRPAMQRVRLNGDHSDPQFITAFQSSQQGRLRISKKAFTSECTQIAFSSNGRLLITWRCTRKRCQI